MWIIRRCGALGSRNVGYQSSWGERVVVRILFLHLTIFCLMDNVSARPLKVFARGYNSKTLPAGGWTHWFNVDYPDGTGDFETTARIVRLYGRSCMGLPCRRPLAIKAVSTYGRTPRLHGDKVFISPRHGLSCHGAHQQSFRCADYKVRFYCPNLHLKCSSSLFYPQHRHHQNTSSSSNTTHSTTPKDIPRAKAARKKQKLLKKLQKGVWENDADIRKKHKRRARQMPRWATKDARTTTTMLTPIAADLSKPRPALLTYHPRHPTFS